MPETFTTRQLAIIAATNKTLYWLFRVADNQAVPTIYRWSTGTVPASAYSVVDNGSTRFLLLPGSWNANEWDQAHTFKIINFSGITLRRSKSESGINAPNDVSFSIINPLVGGVPTYSAANFKGGSVRIALVADDGNGRQIVGSWRFVIKSASPYNQQIDITCEDFLQQYLRGTYPNTRLISEIFPSDKSAVPAINDNICVPEPYGTPYIPLRSIYASSARYYLLGPATGKTYTISEVRNPRATGDKITWTYPTFAMTQSDQTAPDATIWRTFQPIIASSVGGGAVDSPGLWLNGDTFHDIPTKFSETSTVSVTNPADIIRRVLLNMGVSDLDLNGASFDTARTTFTSWGLTWNFAFWFKEDNAKVLSKLLTMCNSCLVVGEQIKLQVLSKTSVKTITDAEVTVPSEGAPASFRFTDSIAEKSSDSGYVAFQQSGESQDLFFKALVAADSATDYPDSATIDLPAVQDADNKFVQKLGTLHYQRKLLKVADVSASLKGLCLIIRPDDIVTIDDSGGIADFGGTYNVLLDEVTIKPDASLDIRAIKFSTTLKDWGDISPNAITVATDGTSLTYAPIYSGPDSPGTTNMPNMLRGRLKVGTETNYILLEPNTPARVALYSASTERLRFGNLNGYLDYVTDLYGIAIGDVSRFLKYDPTNGLRISGAFSAGTISIGTSPNWFKVDADGNIWSGQDTLANAQANTFAVTKAGVLNAITGYLGGSTNGWQIAAGTITSLGTGKIQTAASGARAVLDSSGLAVYDATTQRAKVGSDGAGWLGASDVIAWTSAGVVSIAGFTAGNADITKTSGGNTTIVSSGATAFTAGPTGSPTFTVTQAGALSATSATVSGDYKTSATVGVGTTITARGVWLDTSENSLKFYGDDHTTDPTPYVIEMLSINPTSGGGVDAIIDIGSSGRIPYAGARVYSYASCYLGNSKAAGSGSVWGSIIQTSSKIPLGTTNASVVGASFLGIRNVDSSDDDRGTITFLKGTEITYGHYDEKDQAPVTTSAAGLHIIPYHQKGTIGTSYGILLSAAYTGITPTAYYGFYQEDALAKNFWAGYHLAKGGIRVGTTDTDPGDNNFYVEGTGEFAGQLNFGTAHGTTLLIDHIGEHTGSHGVVFDNSVTTSAAGLVFAAKDSTNSGISYIGDNDSRYITLTDNQHIDVALGGVCSLVQVSDRGGGTGALFLIRSESSTITAISDPDSAWALTDTDNSKWAIYKGASSSSFIIKNYWNTTMTLYIHVIGTVASSTAPS